MAFVRTYMMRYGVSGSRMRESSRSAAMYPIFELGISTVVRCGSMIRDSAELSKPVMNISSGTRIPCLRSARIRSMAMKSLAQINTSDSFNVRFSVSSRRAIIHQRRCLAKSKNGELKLRVILDRFSAEVFINDGEQVMTATIYTDQSAEEISFFADGDVNIDVVKYDLA